MLLVANITKRQEVDSIPKYKESGTSVCGFTWATTGGRCRAGKWSTAIARLAKMTSKSGRSGGSGPRSMATSHKGTRRPAMVTLFPNTGDPREYGITWRAPLKRSDPF